MENRRKNTRVPLMTIARITPHGLQNTVDALVRDISADGMGVYVKGSYQKGDALLVKILIRTDEGEVINESLFGRVAWAAALGSEGQYALGLEFQNIETKNPALYAYIRRMEKLQNESSTT
jgi:c-di-GMP-binding flagellar brake protein YcgR